MTQIISSGLVPSGVDIEGKRNSHLAEGDIVQIEPAVERFGACLLVVTEVKSWGVQGYVQMPGNDGERGQAFFRIENGKFEAVGAKAVWVAS